MIAAVGVVGVSASRAAAEVLPVPDAIRRMATPHVEVHALRGVVDDALIGEQHSRAVVRDARIDLEVVTELADGERWEERAVLDLRDGYRARSFRKVDRRDGRVIGETSVDFATGAVAWTVDGVRQERTFRFTADTYTGPMLALVLAAVPQRPQGNAAIQVLTFRPDPSVYTVRADVVEREVFTLGALHEPTTKIRLKADLGPLRNAVLGSLIPTHYFWFTRARSPEFFAFEGLLSHEGPELLMVPEGRVGATVGDTRLAGTRLADD